MIERIFSLDFGRGNMAGFYGDINVPNPQFKPLMAEGGEPSGFARLKDGSIALGRQMYAVNVNRVASYHINFKAIPNEENRGVMVEYARAWLEYLQKKNPAAFSCGEACWFIGIPTGWRKKEIVEAYRGIFEEAGYPQPIIVPESNAAMYNAQRTYGAIARADGKIGVLCLDLGAYSNDATYILPGKVASYGGFVGAALIEQMLLRLNLEGGYALNKREHNSPELMEVIRAKCGSDPMFRQYLVLQMRQLKERYFTDQTEGKAYSKRDVSLAVDLNEDDPDFTPFVENGEQFCELYVNDDMVRMVTQQKPIDEILGGEFALLPKETQEQAVGHTWLECLSSFLQNTLELCPALAEAGKSGDGGKPVVLLTGGASRMAFVEDVVTQLLPEAELYKDESPMDTIAKGLWLFGPDKLRAMRFDDAFVQILSKQDEEGVGELNRILSQAHDALGEGVIVSLAVGPINCLNQAREDWRTYKCTSDQIVPRAREAFKKHFYEELPSSTSVYSKACKGLIAGKVNELFHELLAESDTERKEVFIGDELEIEYVDTLIWKVLLGDDMYKMLDGLLAEEHELYSSLANPGRLNLFQSRIAIDSVTNDVLCERNKQWAQCIGNILEEFYNSKDVYGPFAMECFYELLQALERQKKLLLGELIVEDVADEE